MASRKQSIGKHLTAGPVCLTMESASRNTARRVFFWGLFLAVVLAAAAYVIVPRVSGASLLSPPPDEPDPEIAALKAELEDTRRSLERALLDLDIAGVTQAELERQLGVLTEQHKEVRSELEFYKSAGGKPRGN